jgi:hypothetical protein
MIFIFGLGFYSFSSTPDANLTVKEASGKAGTTNNLVSIEVTSNIDVRGIQFTLKDDPDVLKPTTPTTVSLNPPPPVSAGVSIYKNDHPGEGLIVIIKSDLGIVIPAGGKRTIEIRYDVAPNTPDMPVKLALIDVKLADKYVNLITNTMVSNSYFSIGPPVTSPPTITGPYVGSCMNFELVNGKSFTNNVEMWWSHYDNSGGSGIDISSVRVWYIDPNGNSGDLIPYPVDSDGGSFIFPASSLNIEGWYTIYISVSDKTGNHQTATATVKVPKSDTCKPKITEPYYYMAGCGGGLYVRVNGATFDKDVKIYWWQSDDSEGLCLDLGIDKTTGSVEITGPNGSENLTPSATITEGGGNVVFPASRLVNGEYTIKINVCDKKSPSPNCANEVTALVHVNNPSSNHPPTKPEISFSNNPVNCGESFTITATSTDPDDGDSIVKYWWQWQKPGESEPCAPWSTTTNSGTTSVSEPGNHIVYCKAEDQHVALSERGSKTLTVVCGAENHPPTKPTISFSKNPVKCGESFTITASSTDPDDGDSIATYHWGWQNPGQPTFWWYEDETVGPESQNVPGDHTVYCITTDEHGASSETGSKTLTVDCTLPNITDILVIMYDNEDPIDDAFLVFPNYAPIRINWVSKDPGAPAGSDYTYGVKKKYYKYQIKGQTTWTTVELNYSSDWINDLEGKYRQWSWFYPGQVLPLGYYNIKMSAEDNAGNKKETEVYAIFVTNL